MLLSSDLDSNYVGKYASGGLPNLDKMLTGSRGFITIGGNHEALWDVLEEDWKEYLYFGRKHKLDNQNILGITLLDEELFVFRNNKWSSVKNQDDFKIDIKLILEKDKKKIVTVQSIDDMKRLGISQIANFMIPVK